MKKIMENQTILRSSRWFLVNIKARRNQVPQHYVEIFKALRDMDPLIDLGRKRSISYKNMDFYANPNNAEVPFCIDTILTSYIIIDPDAFYDKERKEHISMMNWDANVVANVHEMRTVFFPEKHILAVKCGANVSLHHILKYYEDALQGIEPEGFDITTIKNHNIIQQIIDAQSILSLEANISFSNHGHAEGFLNVFDEKIREMNPATAHMKFEGTKIHPLNNPEDGLANAILSQSEANGDVIAKVIPQGENKIVTFKTKEYPEKISVPSTKRNNIFHILYDKIIQRLA